jgi:hypothetical protein
VDEKAGGRVTQLFIETFGSMDRFGGSLMAHFIYGSAWSGLRSLYLRGKRDEARGWISEIVGQSGSRNSDGLRRGF